MDNFFTWDYLATFAGMVAFVTVATQVVKYYINVDPKWIALVAAILGQTAVQAFYLQDYSAQGIVMAIINVFVVVAGSVGAFETLIKPVQRKVKGDGKDV